jgi:hypothetical protein
VHVAQRRTTIWTVTEFEISLRGYDRSAVDALVGTVTGAAGDRVAVEAAITKAEPLLVVLRGYDRRQVDAWLARHRSGEAAAGAAAESQVTLRLLVVLRGYRIAETDALLATVDRALGQDDPFRRAEALRAIAEARLPVAFRGYDRALVDRYLGEAQRVLGR